MNLAILSLIQSHGFRIQPRILNGIVSDTSKYPFYVQILNYNYQNGTQYEDRCGGSLLNDR